MAKAKFCTDCGRNLADPAPEPPTCVKCAPKGERKPFAVITHDAPRSRLTQAYLIDIDRWIVFEIKRETPTMIYDRQGSARFGNSHNQAEAPLRFATKEEAEAFLEAAKAHAARAVDAYQAALKAEREAQDARRWAHQAMRDAAAEFIKKHTEKA